MKQTIFLLIAIYQIGNGQDLKLFFPEMDAVLIQIWWNSNQNLSAQSLTKKLDAHWNEAKPILAKNLEKKDATTIQHMEQLINRIHLAQKVKNYNSSVTSSWALLEQFRKIRNNNCSYEYPLDLLLATYESFQEINYTVYDLMFGLRYWFEFQDLIKVMETKWNNYNCIADSDLIFYSPNLDLQSHNELKEIFDNCFIEFNKSLESGYQPDFEIPCDELGNALLQLIKLYSEKTNYHGTFTDKL